MSVIHVVLNEIAALELVEGERLPSERNLAEKCALSRTSIRNALKELQSRRILEVKRGSGYFLSSQFALQQAVDGKDASWTLNRVLQLIMARSYVEPQAVAMTAEVVTADVLDQLGGCLVELGKAIVGVDAELIMSFHNQFMASSLECCPNQECVRMLNAVRIPQEYLVKLVQHFSEEDRNKFFADHVDLFQAFKQQDKTRAQEVTGRHNQRIADFFERYAIGFV